MALAVLFRDVYKEYPFYQHITAGFKSFLFHLPKSIASLKKTKFVALNGISFEVAKGEVFGIIGRNGSGKSTILGLTAGVMKPDRGSVVTRGKISSLLELGAGFHPELSGIENIILNGILSGNTREEMMQKMQEIIEFSELGDFVYQPLRTYSSGMHARLGFSVAVHIDPEILLVDEALAVGDLEFKEKCNRKMKEFMESGATVIIVSHDMPAIAELCNRVAWIDNGTIMNIGSPRPVIKDYLSSLGIDLDMDEEELLPEPEIESVVIGNGTKEDVDYSSELASAPFSSQGADEITAQDMTEQPEPGVVSWWDSPVVMRQIEEFITGDPETSFYDYLKNEYSIAGLRKGLSICNKLRGLELSFSRYHTCASFETLDEFHSPEQLRQKIRGMKPAAYDMLLSVDVLSHIGNLEDFLIDARKTLKDGGFIIGLEYTGPVNFQWSKHDIDIADALCNALNGRHGLEVTSDRRPVKTCDREYEQDMQTAVSSDSVIPTLQNLFDIVTIRHFGGPLYDLVLDRILHQLDQAHEKDVMIIKTIMHCEQILLKNDILKNYYAMIIGRKTAHGR